MALIVHIFIALSSVIYAGVMSFLPSKTKLTITYGLVGLTLLSGTYLVILTPSRMVSACFSGLFYIALVTVGILITRRRLAQVENK
jgi:hypothetical protein